VSTDFFKTKPYQHQMEDFPFKLPPYAHQMEAVAKSWDREGYAFLADMGTGKSKMLIDTLGMLHLNDLVDFALIIAPKGVFRNWPEKELPEHMSDAVNHRVIRWSSNAGKKAREEMSSVKDKFDGLTVFVMNVEAFSSVKGRNAGEWMAKHFGPRGLIAIDESTTIKNPKAKRTKALTKIAAGFKYRRALTGSPVSNSPMDVYSQFEFLGPRLLGYDSFYAFQGRYAVTQRRKMGAHSFDQIVGYRNIEELTSRIDQHAYRVRKEDCLDLPDRVFTTRLVPLSPDQFKMYEQLRTMAMTMLEGGELVTAPAVITQLLRMQQVLCGHLQTDDGELKTFPCPRLDAAIEIAQESSGKVIYFARFRYDIQQIVERLKKEFGEHSAAAYYGDTTADERSQIMKDFQNPDHPLRFFVGNPATAGYGLTLTQAKTTVFYSNSFSLEQRIQAQDRNYRIGQDQKVLYIDLMSDGTIDEHIVQSLKNKIDLSAKVLGEEAMKWLSLKPSK
jgi:SNF2 family DNA or RNA helicase